MSRPPVLEHGVHVSVGMLPPSFESAIGQLQALLWYLKVKHSAVEVLLTLE
jgi:hypothetical protein